MPAEGGGDDVSGAVRAHREPRAHGRVADARQVDGQERRDERAEAVDDGSSEKDPDRWRERAELVAEAHAVTARSRAESGRTSAPALRRTAFPPLPAGGGACPAR